MLLYCPKCFWCPLSEVCGRLCFGRVDLTSIPQWLVLSLFKFTSFSPPNSQFGIKNISPPNFPSLKKIYTYKHVYTKCSLVSSISCILCAPQHGCQLSHSAPTLLGVLQAHTCWAWLPMMSSPKGDQHKKHYSYNLKKTLIFDASF